MIQLIARADTPVALETLDARFRWLSAWTIIDGAPSTLSSPGAVRGMRVRPLGTDRYGQTGDLTDLYRTYRLGAGAIIDATAKVFERG